MAYNIIMDNIGGELDRWIVETQEELIAKLVEIVSDLGSLYDGDVFKVIEVDGVAK
jgi:hypothetical protein